MEQTQLQKICQGPVMDTFLRGGNSKVKGHRDKKISVTRSNGKKEDPEQKN